MKKKFNPKEYRGKNTVYTKVDRVQGVSYIWDWDSNKGIYRKRASGLRYYAYKRVRVGGKSKQVSQSFPSLNEARDYRKVPGLGPVNTGSMTFKQLQDKYFEHIKDKIKPTTLTTYKVNSKHFWWLNDFYVTEINPQVIDQWLKVIKKPEYLSTQHKTRTSYRHDLSILKQIFKYYSEYLDDDFKMPIKDRHRGDCIVDKARYLKSKDKNNRKFLTRQSCELFLKNLKQVCEKAPVYYFLAEFQLKTGLRIGEVCALDWKDIELGAGSVHVSKTVHWFREKGKSPKISGLTKTSEARKVPLVAQLLPILLDWRAQSGRSKGLVFSENGFCPVPYRPIQYRYNRAFKMSNLNCSSTHILRHSFATDFLGATGDLNALKKIMGHKNIEQTEHYAKLTEQISVAGMRVYEATFAPKNK